MASTWYAACLDVDGCIDLDLKSPSWTALPLIHDHVVVVVLSG